MQKKASKAAPALVMFLGCGLLPFATANQQYMPPVEFVLTLAEAPLGQPPTSLLPQNAVLLRQPATPRSGVRTTNSIETHNKDGSTWTMVPEGALMIEALVYGQQGYCGLALRKGADKYRNHMALCGVDLDTDGTFDKLYLERNLSGRMRSPYEIEQLAPLPETSLAYRRLGASELPRSDIILRYTIFGSSTPPLPKRKDLLQVVLEPVQELVPAVADPSAQSILLMFSGPDEASTRYEIPLGRQSGERRQVGPYVVQLSDIAGTGQAAVEAAAAAGNLYFRARTIIFSGVIPAHTYVLEQTGLP